MIVRVTFSDNLIMLFGDSYKPWTMQFDEYYWNYKRELTDIIKVETTSSKWIGWGGLKWCSHDNFQEQLNREGCQSEDNDNLNPRQYNEMIFKENKQAYNKIKKIINSK